MRGSPYWNVVDGSGTTQVTDLLQPEGELDRIYQGVARPLQVVEPAREHRLHLAQTGFEDVVVWNPGAARAASLADLAPGEWRNMLCVEAARIANPVQLMAGQRCIGTQRVSMSPRP